MTTIKHTPDEKWSKSDFHITIYPAIAAFVSYHNSLDPALQQKLVKCLQSGMQDNYILYIFILII